MTPEQVGENIGMWIGICGIAAFIIWTIWALIRYRPFKTFIQFLYDVRKVVIQIMYMYGNRPSLFSIKRFHTGLVTYWALSTASWYIYTHRDLQATELMLIIAPFLGTKIYDVYQTQQDKKIDKSITENLNTNDKS